MMVNIALAQCPSIGDSGIKKAILDYSNAQRKQGAFCGERYFAATTSLIWNDLLAKAAWQHAEDQAANQFLGHRSSDNKDLANRLDALGYQWHNIGENVGFGNDKQGFGNTAKNAVNTWMNSPGHCANLMNPAFQELGAAAAKGKCEPCHCLYWTVIFGTP